MEQQSSFLQKCGQIFTRYIRCNLLDAVIVGGANALFLWALGLPYVGLISVIAGIANLIPTFGPVIGAVVGAILLLLRRPIGALWFLLFTAALQLLDGYILKPRLFGSSLGVPAVIVLLATLLGGYFFGILGVLLAVPAAAIVRMIFRRRARTGGTADPEPPESEKPNIPPEP